MVPLLNLAERLSISGAPKKVFYLITQRYLNEQFFHLQQGCNKLTAVILTNSLALDLWWKYVLVYAFSYNFKWYIQ